MGMYAGHFDFTQRLLWTVSDLFSPAECAAIVAPEREWLQATVNSAEGTKSLLTLMVYLNDDFEGGETEFPEQEQTITPRTGTALLFQHMLLHAGTRVRAGVKLVLRSDVLYRPER